MISKNQLLVTTALKETWGTNEPIVFLGEWCRLYDRKDEWSKRTYSVIRNHWDDRKKLRADHEYLKELHNLLLVDLVGSLNSYHCVDHPLRYWQMILDPWLLTYVAVIWDRWESVRLAFEEHRRLKTIAYKTDTVEYPFLDYKNFINKILGDEWNFSNFLDIIESNYSDRCEVIRLPAKVLQNDAFENYFSNPGKSRSLKYKAEVFIDGLLAKWTKANRVVLVNSYFAPFTLLKLNWKLRQLPRLYRKEFEWPRPIGDLKTVKANAADRKNILLTISPRNPFEVFLFDRIVRDIPFVYIEGFLSLYDMAIRIPIKPKVILSANAHWWNEIFKFWTADQVLKKVKFIAMEHGGCFPLAYSAMSFEEEIADLKTTWSLPFHQKHKRMPVNLTATRNLKSTKNYLAIIGLEIPRYTFRVEGSPKAGQISTQNEMVYDFYLSLKKEAQSAFQIRPYPNLGWNTRQQFIDKLGAEKVSEEKDYYRFLSRARVIVCTYPQTTFAEAMISGIPSILVYPANLWETIPEMDTLIDTLRAAKVVFHDSKEAAEHINAVWDNPERWWNSSEVINARKEFQNRVVDVDDWMNKWTSFIKELL